MENISHNTSYNDLSPNVHEPDEELVNPDDQFQHRQVYYDEVDEEYAEDYVDPYQAPEVENNGFILPRPNNRNESPEPPNISNSEIEELNYTMGG